MEEYKTYKLQDVIQDIAAGPFGSNLPVSCFTSSGFPIIDGANLKGFSVTDNITKFVSEGKARSLHRSIAKRGDVIVTISGTIGQIAYIPEDSRYTEYLVSQRQFRVSFDQTKIYIPFLVYYFHTAEGQHKILSFANQTGVPALSQPLKNFKNIEVKIPSVEAQRKMMEPILSLDSKIEINRRINGNLEQQVQALFKAWFVDFEPFKNGKFVDSELGRIPEGWKVGQLDELVEIKYGKDHKKLLPGNIPVYGSGGIMRHVNMPIYEKESVLIPRKGSLNNVLYVNHPFWTVDTMFYTRMKINGIAKFIYLFISPIDLLSMNNGSAVPSMTTEILSKIRLVIPSKNIFDNFESLVAPSFDKIGSCNKEICKLSNLRDTLLPKLLSGELSINTITE